MIIYTSIFGTSYIDDFFDIALESLMTPGNLPSIEGEELSLLIGTTKRDMPHINKKIRQSEAVDIFRGKISFICVDSVENINGRDVANFYCMNY